MLYSRPLYPSSVTNSNRARKAVLPAAHRLLALVTVFLAATSVSSAEVTLLGLNSMFEQGSIELTGISDDGSTFIGTHSVQRHVGFQIPFPAEARRTVYQSFQWSSERGVEVLPSPDAYFSLYVQSLSSNANVYVGAVDRVGTRPNDQNPFVIDGAVSINGQLPEAIGHLDYVGGRSWTNLEYSELLSISSDGGTAVGYSDDRWDAGWGSIARPIVWQAGAGMSGLDVPEQLWPEFASGVSARARWVNQDGTTVIGKATRVTDEFAQLGYWFWDSESRTARLASDVLGVAVDRLIDVSKDGQHIIGENADGIFLWSSESLVELPDLPSSRVSFSNDGSTLLGAVAGGDGFAWDDRHGLRSVRQFLMEDHQLSGQLDGWTELSANLLSANGMTVAGRGINVNGVEDVWIVRTVPEPASSICIVMALSLLLPGWRCRRSPSSHQAVGPSNYEEA